MAIVGQLTAEWGDTSTDVLSGRVGTHKYDENGLYQIRVQDEDGNYGLAIINVVLKPKVTGQVPAAGLSVNVVGDMVTLLLQGQHFSAGMQFVVNPKNYVPESEWAGVTWVSSSACEITFPKVKLLDVPVGQTLVIKLRYRDPANSSVGYPSYLPGPDVTVMRLDQPAGKNVAPGAFSDQFSSEFDVSPVDVSVDDVERALSGTVEQAIAWVAQDTVKAAMAMSVEVAGKNRSTLLAALQDIADAATRAKG